MKKAKFILAIIATLTIVGGTLAFKSYRFGPRCVFTLLVGSKVTSITVNGIVYTTTIPNCTLTNLCTTAIGPPVDVSSTTTNPASTTKFLSGANFIVATFPYCTLWHTATSLVDESKVNLQTIHCLK